VIFVKIALRWHHAYAGHVAATPATKSATFMYRALSFIGSVFFVQPDKKLMQWHSPPTRLRSTIEAFHYFF
jgi:hypothetical protein